MDISKNIRLDENTNTGHTSFMLNLRSGDLVKVRSQDEILSTLDERGCLENLPFMPEMLQYCGKQFLVDKRADKTCDTISRRRDSRRMRNAVYLENVRCDGNNHGGCDATCLIFWKEAWLRKVGIGDTQKTSRNTKHSVANRYSVEDKRCTADNLFRTKRINNSSSGEEKLYSCQATELVRATQRLHWWDIRQYWRDLASGNFKLKEAVLIISRAGIYGVLGKIRGFRIHPYFDTRLMIEGSTPTEILDLQPGEIAQVKGLSDILRTLNKYGYNRGLYYDLNGEMLQYCNKKAKVLKRVRKVIDERTGKLLLLKNESIILEGFVCCGHYSPNRLMCPRKIYSFWREIWLKRVSTENN